jgi:hypothetical protein
MPRASRYFLPGYVWHITHRCHSNAPNLFKVQGSMFKAGGEVPSFQEKHIGLSVLN